MIYRGKPAVCDAKSSRISLSLHVPQVLPLVISIAGALRKAHRMKIVCSLVLLAAALSGPAQTNLFITFTNATGPHVNMRVVRVTDTAVIWRDDDSGNGGSVRLADLPEKMRAVLGYNAAKAAQAEQTKKDRDSALLAAQAASEAEAARLRHWETLQVLTMEASTWSRYRCLVTTERGETRTVVIGNMPASATSLSGQLREAQAKGVVLDQQIQAGNMAIAQGKQNKEAAWNRYIYTDDSYINVNTTSRGSTADTAATRAAAPRIIQGQIEQAQAQVAFLKRQYEDSLALQKELKSKLANVRVKALYTGYSAGGLQLWDCTGAVPSQ